MTSKRKKLFIGLGITLFFLSIINVCFFINRNTNASLIYDEEATYAEIYFVNEAPHISGFEKLSEDTLLFKINNNNRPLTWEVSVDDSFSYLYNGINPAIKILDSLHRYKINYNDVKKDSINLLILLTPKEKYEKQNNSNITNYFIEKTSVPIISNPLHSLTEWTFDYSGVPDSQNEEATRMIYDQMKIEKNDSTLVKIQKIGRFIIDNYNSHLGIPIDQMQNFTPLEQFKCVINNQSEVWCGNFATLFAYFANLAGIPTRNVGAEGEIDGVNLSAHSFCESYVKEQNRWAFVDLLSNKLYVFKEKNQVLNTIDLVFLQHTGRKENVYAMTYKNDTLKAVKYEDADESERIYFKSEAMLMLRYPFNVPNYNSVFHKLYRYITVYPYALYYTFSHKKSNLLYIIKQTSIYLLLINFLLWAGIGISLIRINSPLKSN